MDKAHFDSLAQQGYNRIPFVKQLLADFETPLSVYTKLANKPFSYLLESIEGGEKWGRYSIIGLPCQTIIRVYGNQISVSRDHEIIEKFQSDDPLTWIENFHKNYRVFEVTSLPRFSGGLVGYFGYDTVRYVENRLGPAPKLDTLNSPDILLMLSDELVVFDNLKHMLYFIVHADPQNQNAYQQAHERLDELVTKLKKTPVPDDIQNHSDKTELAEFVSNTDSEHYQNAINRIKQYIVDGDVMQVVYSHRMSAPFHAKTINLYRALRHLNPSPYMYYFNLDDFYIVGASPEVLVRVEDGQITLRPLAGTRPRGKTDIEDQALEKELLADPKEIAEHLMLIDLGRNDVGRVSSIGSVQVTKMMAIERYSHVMHISSNIVGNLKPGLTAMDALRAALPAGTLSGAPKIRAMEIIDQLEISKRGIYGGAVGYLAWNGNMDTAIALRTAIVKDGVLYIQAGGGIVADSQIESEWQETQRKAKAIFQAAAWAEKGLETCY